MTKKERNKEFAKMLKEYPKYFGRLSFRDKLLVRVAFDYVLDADFAQTQTKLLGERCNQLLKDKGDLTDKCRELEQQIEKMKCCGNCRFSESDTLNGTFCHREGCFVVASAKCKLWEM